MANNQDGIIGALVPDVYIEKISLESSGATIIEDNPHIDHKRESISAQVAQKDAGHLVVKLNLLMKEKLDNDLVGTWFNEQDIGKYLNLMVFQCTDDILTSVISAGTDAIDLINPAAPMSDTDARMVVAMAALGVSSVDEVQEIIASSVKVKKISVKKDVDGNDSKLSQYKSRVDENGNVVYDITYGMQFEVPTTRPKHLSYFAVSSLDIRQMALDFDLDIDALPTTNGKLVSEVVIDNFDVVARSYIFHDENNDIWTGVTHKTSDNQWMTGTPGTAISQALTLTAVSNTKVQDFRNVIEVEKLTIDFSVLEKAVFGNNLTKRLSNDITVPKPKESFFSEMMLSRDKDGDAKFFFSIDMEKMIIENTLFGRLIKTTPRLRSELIEGSQIRSMRVYRQRIKEDSSLSISGTPQGVSPFNNNDALELVANSGESSWKTFASNNNAVGSLREVELNSSGDFLGVRHFSGIDKTMSEVTDGVYRYVVDVDVDDATVEIIEKKIHELLLAKTDLVAYYSLCSQQSMSKYIAEVRDPHIDSPDEFAGTKGKTAGNYDPISNRFTQSFEQRMRAAYRGEKRLGAPWIAPVAVYIDVLGLFTNYISDRSNRYKLLNSLYSFISPKTGNPSGVAATIKMIDDLANTLAKLIGTTITTSPKKYAIGSSQRSSSHGLSSSPKKTFSLRKDFLQVFDSEVVKAIGVDYLSRGEDETLNDDSIRTISGDVYSDRIDKETLGYFETLQPDINIAVSGRNITENDSVSSTSFTYLTPARFDTTSTSTVVLDGANGAESVAIKNKKSRAIRSLTDGEVSKDDTMLELYTTMLHHKSIDSPVVGVNMLKGEPSKNSKRAALGSIAGAMQGMALTMNAIKVTAEKDSDDNMLLKTLFPSITVVPEFTTSCQVPDALQTEPENNREDPLLGEDTEALLPLFGSIMTAAIINGSNDRSKRTLRKTNTVMSKAVQSASDNTRLPFAVVANVNNLQVTSTANNKIIQGLNKAVTEEEFKLFPNQIKAVFLHTAGSSIVKRGKFENVNATTSLGRMKAAAAADLSYEMVNEVNFLEDYKRDSDGNIMILEPVWSNLTQEKYDMMAGQGILCRMKPYSNSAIGLKRKKGLSAVMYDEYFILTPKKTFKPLPPTFPAIIETGVLTARIVEDIKATLPGLVIVQDTSTESSAQSEDTRTGPVKIEIYETDSNGVRSGKAYNIGDTATSTTGKTAPKKEVTVRGTKVMTSTQVVVELVAQDCQSNNVETEFLQGNLIEVGTVLGNLEVAAATEGVELVMIGSVLTAAFDEPTCTDETTKNRQRTQGKRREKNK